MATSPEDDRKELTDFIAQLGGRNRELVIDLMRKSALLSDADDLIKRWRAELEIVASKGGHNLCHIWIPDLLKRTIGHTGNFPDPEGMTKAEFKIGCGFYQDDIFGPDKVPIYSEKVFNRKAVFLDRDGTLIEAIHRPNFPENSLHKKEITAPFKMDELVFAPDVYEALDMIRRAGFLDPVITNQPDVAHGYMEADEWQRIQSIIETSLDLRHVYMCRHKSEDDCNRKKPLPGMFFDARDNLGIDLSRSWMIGDTEPDMLAGKAAGCRTILLDRFYNQGVRCDWRASDLVSAVKTILIMEKLSQT